LSESPLKPIQPLMGRIIRIMPKYDSEDAEMLCLLGSRLRTGIIHIFRTHRGHWNHLRHSDGYDPFYSNLLCGLIHEDIHIALFNMFDSNVSGAFDKLYNNKYRFDDEIKAVLP
jgi:hypothetical protein